MQEIAVSCTKRSGAIALAPSLGNPSRGIHQVYGQWGSGNPQVRASLGASISFSRRPRNRVGLNGVARAHPRHQRERNVHRVRRSALGRCGIFRATHTGQAGKTQLFCETRRTWSRHGRLHFCGRGTPGNSPNPYQSSFRKFALTRYSFPDDKMS